MNLIDHIKNKLAAVKITCFYLVRSKNPPCVSFEIFDEGGALFGDGVEKVTSGKLQIDIFSKQASEIRGLRKEVAKAVLTGDGLMDFTKTYPDECRYEKDVSLYHHVIVFEFYYLTESEVI